MIVLAASKKDSEGDFVFGPDSCIFIQEREAIRNHYMYVKGKTEMELWYNLMLGNIYIDGKLRRL